MAAVDTNIINARAQPHKNLPSFSTKVQAPVLSSTNRPVASSRHNPANVAPIPALNLHCLPPDPQLPNVDSQHYTRYPQQLVKAQKTTQITPKMGPPAALTALKDYSKLGYCENCRRYYEDFDQHISTEQHRRYAQDTTKFEQLDELLATVQRKPKGLPNLLEKDITTDDRAEKDQRSSSANVLNTSVATKTSETDNSFDTKTDIYTENDTQSMATEENVNQLLVGSLGKSFLKASAVTTNDDSNQERQRQPSKLQQEKVVAEEAKEAQVKDNKKDLGEQGDEVADFEIEQSAVPKEEEGVDEGMHEVGDGDNVEKELSSELERLDVSENGEEEQDVGHDEGYEDSIKVAMEEQSTEPIAFPSTEISPLSISRHTVSTDNRLIDKPLLSTPTLKRTSVSQIKAASQIETDATQPDERFLEESNLGTVSTDPVTPIRLALSMTSADTDGLEAAPPTLKNIFAMSEEGSGEEMDDAVALLKSPSAGRNAFARTQGLDLGRGKEKTFTSNIPEGSFKRKLELALAEDAEDMDMHYDFYSRSHLSAIPRTEQSITYDDKLQCNLMSQPSHRYRHQQKYQQQSHTPPYIPAWTSPPALPRHQQGHNLALTSASLPSPIQFGALQPTPPSSRYLTQQGQIDTPNGGALQRQQTRYPGTSADLSSFSIHNNPLQLQQYHCTPVSIPTPAPLLQQMSMQQQQGQYFEGNVDEYITDADYDQSLYKGRLTSSTSPTSPLSHRQFDFSGPSMPSRTLNLMDSFNCSQGTAQMSPRRSPSHHASHRSQTYFPVMSHAEQERERCYHYSRGNRLPEPAGQKKMRNSSSLEEAFEEYGEGCMVFIE
ncbi:hypothetical protein BCR41DRAFT_393171 [Lobosporangium transversale]|uniref:DBF4-type domain-containing protein n=1 Tax=Lobosporangium transversale TaxID=64571 RepID=A0A1Y2GXZ4_9FUNG|nr:hypothetical protein BCR41DRAFT_393171 [Lobosporangium transversale]ORZ27159.1 hypothetical protein BCR41DRAFT_393171 [Lobosporangium transversale]|eukprot:XP_021884906.1 hypothetical protein BCR41DRAFT_393171 [Lobosporangium transversale]